MLLAALDGWARRVDCDGKLSALLKGRITGRMLKRMLPTFLYASPPYVLSTALLLPAR